MAKRSLHRNPTNKYFDTELCHENILGLTSSTGPCLATSSSVPSGSSWYTVYNNSTSSAGEYQPVAGTTFPTPLPYKWVRVTVKTDNMTPAAAQSPATGAVMCEWHEPSTGDNLRVYHDVLANRKPSTLLQRHSLWYDVHLSPAREAATRARWWRLLEEAGRERRPWRMSPQPPVAR